MGRTRLQMTQDLKLKGYAENTISEYTRCAWHYVAYHRKPAEEMGVPEIRQFLLHRQIEEKVGNSTLKVTVAALRFLYSVTLKRPEVAVEIAYPKVQSALPDILSGTEVTQLLEAMEKPMYRAIVMTAYGAGLRVSEVCQLRVEDIDSQRMLIHVRQGKGGVDRFVPLPERVLFTLRQYWKAERPKGPQLFPGKEDGRGISPDAVRSHLHKAAEKLGLQKRVTPHVLRHSFATHLLELGTDIRVIQMLLGHSSIRTTLRYTRVTRQHVARVQSPVDVLGTDRAKTALG
jgi:integrase/recombinase XerD